MGAKNLIEELNAEVLQLPRRAAAAETNSRLGNLFLAFRLIAKALSPHPERRFFYRKEYEEFRFQLAHRSPRSDGATMFQR